MPREAFEQISYGNLLSLWSATLLSLYNGKLPLTIFKYLYTIYQICVQLGAKC